MFKSSGWIEINEGGNMSLEKYNISIEKGDHVSGQNTYHDLYIKVCSTDGNAIEKLKKNIILELIPSTMEGLKKMRDEEK